MSSSLSSIKFLNNENPSNLHRVQTLESPPTGAAWPLFTPCRLCESDPVFSLVSLGYSAIFLCERRQTTKNPLVHRLFVDIRKQT